MEERANLIAPALQLRGSKAISPGMTEANEPPMRVAILPVTAFQQNCSLIWCTRTMKAALVDPGGDLDRLKAALEKAGVASGLGLDGWWSTTSLTGLEPAARKLP